MRILVIDDHQITRMGLRVILKELEPDAAIDEAEDGITAGKLIKENKYRLCLMDLNLPRTDSNQLMLSIKTAQPEIRLLVISMNSEDVYGLNSLKNGADGFVSKANGYEEIKKAIIRVLDNNKYMSNELIQSLIETKITHINQNPFSRLTEKELEITRDICEGMSTKEIAARTKLAISSISTYKTKIFHKMQVNNLIELAELYKIHILSRSNDLK